MMDMKREELEQKYLEEQIMRLRAEMALMQADLQRHQEKFNKLNQKWQKKYGEKEEPNKEEK